MSHILREDRIKEWFKKEKVRQILTADKIQISAENEIRITAHYVAQMSMAKVKNINLSIWMN